MTSVWFFSFFLQRWEVDALGDANMRALQKGDILQLERKGYFIVDRPLIRPGQPIVLLAIPDGHLKKQPGLAAAAPAAAAAAAAPAAVAPAAAAAAPAPAASAAPASAALQSKPSFK
jgi:glutamyl-tRNA synthetase